MPPDRMFINLYPPGIGRSVGSVFESQRDADQAATSHRLACVEVVPASVVQSHGVVFLNPSLYARVQEAAAKEGLTVRDFIERQIAAKVEGAA